MLRIRSSRSERETARESRKNANPQGAATTAQMRRGQQNGKDESFCDRLHVLCITRFTRWCSRILAGGLLLSQDSQKNQCEEYKPDVTEDGMPRLRRAITSPNTRRTCGLATIEVTGGSRGLHRRLLLRIYRRPRHLSSFKASSSILTMCVRV